MPKVCHRMRLPTPQIVQHAFYCTVKPFFPNLDKESFLAVFKIFITLPDFTEFLKNVPIDADVPLSKADMNAMLVQFAQKIKSNNRQSRRTAVTGATSRATTASRAVTASRATTASRAARITIGGSHRRGNLDANARHEPHPDSIFFFIQFCLSILVLFRIPRRLAPFFIVLVLFMFINLTEYYLGIVPRFDLMPFTSFIGPRTSIRNHQARAESNLIAAQMPLIPIEIGTLLAEVVGWVRRFYMSAASQEELAVSVPSPPSHPPAPHPHKQRSFSPKVLHSKVARKPDGK